MVFIADNNNLIPLFVMFRYNFMYLCHKRTGKVNILTTVHFVINSFRHSVCPYNNRMVTRNILYTVIRIHALARQIFDYLPIMNKRTERCDFFSVFDFFINIVHRSFYTVAESCRFCNINHFCSPIFLISVLSNE